MNAEQFGTQVLGKVTELGTVEDGLIAAYRGALEANEVPQETVDKVMAFVEERKAEIAQALLANTPHEPPAEEGAIAQQG